LQMQMLQSLPKVKFSVADTMNLWISTERPALLALLQKIDGLVLNDGEARLLTEESNLVAAAKKVLGMGPKFVIVKKGEHGSLMVSRNEIFALPAYPTDKVIDPTGAGDSFAGGLMGYLAASQDFSPTSIHRAMSFGSVVASFTISDFSFGGLSAISKTDLEQRWKQYKAAVSI
jgi:cytidine kinase